MMHHQHHLTVSKDSHYKQCRLPGYGGTSRPVGGLGTSRPGYQLINPRHIRVMSRLRLRNTDLRIVTGAWRREERVDRLCTLCRLNALDDETHLIFECPQFERLRRKYIPAEYLASRSHVKCIELINCANARTINRLCDYLTSVLKLRLGVNADGPLPRAPPRR